MYVLYEEEEEAEKGAEPKQGSTDSLNPVTLRSESCFGCECGAIFSQMEDNATFQLIFPVSQK